MATLIDLEPTFKGKYGICPIGTVIAYCPGHFNSANNGPFVPYADIGTVNITNINNFFKEEGWYVCDGSVPNSEFSPIWNTTGRHLPNLTDDRFIMGSSSAGPGGGSNDTIDISHTHSVTANVSIDDHSLTLSNLPAHTHTINHDHGTQTFSTVETLLPDETSADSKNSFTTSASDTAAVTFTNQTLDVEVNINSFASNSGSVGDNVPVTHNVNSSPVTSSGMSGTSSIEVLPKYVQLFYLIRVF